MGQQDPGPFLSDPWMVDPEQWWTVIELPQTFANLQNRTPAGLLAYLQSIKPTEAIRDDSGRDPVNSDL